MNQIEKEQLLNEIEHKIGMIKVFYKDNDGAEELIKSYEEYTEKGVSYTEIKLFLEDLNLFLEGTDKYAGV